MGNVELPSFSGHLRFFYDPSSKLLLDYGVIIFYLSVTFESLYKGSKALKASGLIVRQTGVISFPGESCFVPSIWVALQLLKKLLVNNVLISDRRILQPEYIQTTQFFVVSD